MALIAILGIVALSCLMALGRWRTALFSMVVIAAVQDPLRKLIPGAPGFLALASLPVFIASVITLANQRPTWLRDFGRMFPRLARQSWILLILMVPPALISATYGPGSWMLTLLGGFSYLSPMAAVLVGFHFARNEHDLRRLLAFYCTVTAVMLSGSLIEYLDLWPASPLIGTGALDFNWIRHSSDFIVKLVAGFYRSPDVMGWHAAAVAMIALVLASTTKGTKRLIWLAVAVYALFPLMVSGRRKMLYMVPLFVGVLAWAHWTATRASSRLVAVSLLVVPLLAFTAATDWLGEDSTYVRYYSDDAVEETLTQFERHTLDAVVATYQQAGFLGSGLGVATPGSHHLAVARPRVWQESGVSRVVVELGVPGAVALALLLGVLLTTAWRLTRAYIVRSGRMGSYAAGLFAFTLSNLGSLAVSGQILADAFILLFLGLLFGMLLSVARLPLESREPDAQGAYRGRWPATAIPVGMRSPRREHQRP